MWPSSSINIMISLVLVYVRMTSQREWMGSRVKSVKSKILTWTPRKYQNLSDCLQPSESSYSSLTGDEHLLWSKIMRDEGSEPNERKGGGYSVAPLIVWVIPKMRIPFLNSGESGKKEVGEGSEPSEAWRGGRAMPSYQLTAHSLARFAVFPSLLFHTKELGYSLICCACFIVIYFVLFFRLFQGTWTEIRWFITLLDWVTLSAWNIYIFIHHLSSAAWLLDWSYINNITNNVSTTVHSVLKKGCH